MLELRIREAIRGTMLFLWIVAMLLSRRWDVRC